MFSTNPFALVLEKQLIAVTLDDLVGLGAVTIGLRLVSFAIGNHSKNPVRFGTVGMDFEQLSDCLPRSDQVSVRPSPGRLATEKFRL